ncbi:hypothetical protein FHS56_000257 [Thermonema lapsum]|uniref:Type 9 secretion system plug protein N-terminal domain-containing protein n=1 Tax=Thermonema lapsum TaxID=28195 RepID=A0A846MMT2_9BACT|nr:type IX secretion system plug protein domain-containing protein [Thermonema lapsum]NIK72771.1 hypothetical protein [Thermonema lapsum]
MERKATCCFALVLLLFAGCMPVSYPVQQNEVPLIYDDHRYHADIYTDLLYPLRGEQEVLGEPPVIALGSNERLRLRFDDLGEDVRDFYVKIQHCQHDWTPSSLPVNEYLDSYNEFNIVNYVFSFQTRQRYVHYRFDVPPVKHSGNYLLTVYSRPDGRPVLSRRFMVYETRPAILQGEIQNSALPSELRSHQQVSWTVEYSPSLLNISYPQEQLYLYVQQNYDANNRRLYSPSRVDELQNRVEYRDFTGKQSWEGGNEYRRFEAGSLRFLGFHVAEVVYPESSDSLVQVHLGRDKSRRLTPYFSRNDMNGLFLVQNYDNDLPHAGSDYVEVHFYLETDGPPPPQGVYVVGAFNRRRCTEANRMHYDSSRQVLSASLRLKQGVYDYAYATPDSSGSCRTAYWEGNFQETRNVYEGFLYYSAAPGRPDRLIAYRRLP